MPLWVADIMDGPPKQWYVKRRQQQHAPLNINAV